MHLNLTLSEARTTTDTILTVTQPNYLQHVQLITLVFKPKTIHSSQLKASQ